MTQNFCVSVQMDEKSFHDFASFDLLRHNKGWQRPAVFTAILLVCAGICLSQIGKREVRQLQRELWILWQRQVQ